MNDKWIIIFLLIAQLFDGIFTYIGAMKFGIGIEMNPIIAFGMKTIGIAPALGIAKIFGIICLIFVYRYLAFSKFKWRKYLSLLLIILCCLYTYALFVGALIALG